MSRKVALSGTGESVSTIGAPAFTSRISSTIRTTLASFSSTVVRRKTWRSESKMCRGTPRQKTPPVSRSCQTSASPMVKTKAPASRRRARYPVRSPSGVHSSTRPSVVTSYR